LPGDIYLIDVILQQAKFYFDVGGLEINPKKPFFSLTISWSSLDHL
jgi:hypothetical protein